MVGDKAQQLNSMTETEVNMTENDTPAARLLRDIAIDSERRQAKIAELATYLPEQVIPPSRAEIKAFQKTDAFMQAVDENKVRAAINSLCTRKPTTVVIGEPDTSGWTPDMLLLYRSCKGQFCLKDGYMRTMYLADDDALDRALASARAFPEVSDEQSN